MKAKFKKDDEVIVKITDDFSIYGTVKDINKRETIIIVKSTNGRMLICRPSELKKIN